MAEDTPADTAAPVAPAPPLTIAPFPDGTGRIGVAVGWTAQSLGQGAAVLDGPDGAMVDVGISVGALDPRGSMHQQAVSMGLPPTGLVIAYVADPAHALVAVAREIAKQRGRADPHTTIEAAQPLAGAPGIASAIVSGTETRNDTAWRFVGVVSLSPPGPAGSWSLGVSMQSAPDAAFAHHAPAMMAMANSFVLDFEARRKQLGLAEGAVTEIHGTAAAVPPPDPVHSGGASDGPALTLTPFPDGTGRIGVASGWSATVLGGGCAVLVRADGAQVSMGVCVVALDPNGSAYAMRSRMNAMGVQTPPALVLPYVADPAQAFVAINRALMMQGGQPDPEMTIVETKPAIGVGGAHGAYVAATYRKNAVLRRVRGVVSLFAPAQTGNWMLSGNLVSAPDATFDADEPVLLAMFNSFSVDGSAMSERTAASHATVTASLEQSRKDQADVLARAKADGVTRRNVAATSTSKFVEGMFHSDAPM
jgi:hypothetical protein